MITSIVDTLTPYAIGRRLPFSAVVEYREEGGQWKPEISSSSVTYLADWYCDLKALHREVRIITDLGTELYR